VAVAHERTKTIVNSTKNQATSAEKDDGFRRAWGIKASEGAKANDREAAG
jgi:hypothetical protein